MVGPVVGHWPRGLPRSFLPGSPYGSNRISYNVRMNWKDYIVADPAVLGGKPAVKGTRISVEFIIQRLAQAWTEAQLLDNYPRLTAGHLQAVFACERELQCPLSSRFVPYRHAEHKGFPE